MLIQSRKDKPCMLRARPSNPCFLSRWILKHENVKPSSSLWWNLEQNSLSNKTLCSDNFLASSGEISKQPVKALCNKALHTWRSGRQEIQVSCCKCQLSWTRRHSGQDGLPRNVTGTGGKQTLSNTSKSWDKSDKTRQKTIRRRLYREKVKNNCLQSNRKIPLNRALRILIKHRTKAVSWKDRRKFQTLKTA